MGKETKKCEGIPRTSQGTGFNDDGFLEVKTLARAKTVGELKYILAGLQDNTSVTGVTGEKLKVCTAKRDTDNKGVVVIS